jgi:beta-lactamase regulating signal transducer with metallopeptidase domain/ankyrin repeat protein
MSLSFPPQLISFGGWIWEASWQAALIALVVLLVQTLLGGKLTAGWRHGLWLLVIARLLLPDLPASKTSLYNAMPPELRSGSFSIRPALGYQGHASPAPSPAQPSPSSVSSIAPSKPFPWQESLLALWLTGAALSLFRLAASSFSFRRLIRRTRQVPSATMQALLHDAANTLRMRAPEMIETSSVDSPAVTGLWRPLVLLPPGLEKKFEPEEIRFLLLHELAHIRRGDLWANMLACILGALHWFNPILWLAFRRLRQDREAACDASVLSTQPPSSCIGYGEALIKVLEGMQNSRRPAAVVGILESHGQLRRRLRQIASHVKPSRLAIAGGAALLVTLAATLLTRAEEKPAAEPTASSNSPTATYAERILAAARAEDGPSIEKIILESYDGPTQIGESGGTEILNSLVGSRELKPFATLLSEMRRTNLGKNWQPNDELLASLVKDGRTDYLELFMSERLDLARLRKIGPAADPATAAWIASRTDAVEKQRKDIDTLIKACAKGEIDTVRQLLDSGVSVNARSNDGDSWTPLTRAASAGKTEIVRLLLERGAEADLPKHPGWDYTPLCLTSKVEIANLLKAAGANVHATLFKRDTSILTYVATFNGAPMVQWFIDQGVDPKLIGDNDQTLLFGVKDAETAEILLKAGVDPNRPDEFGRFAIQEARNAGAVRALLKGGAKLTGPKGSLIPGMIQMSSGDAVEAIFETGEVPDQKTLQNALISACHTDKAETARTLLKYGAKANEPGEWSGPDHMIHPLLVCCVHGSPKTAKVLLEYGADPNGGQQPDQFLKTAIHNQETEMVKILKAAGARGASDLTISIATGDKNRQTELLAQAPSFEADPSFWDGVVMAAAERGQIEIVKAAVQHGAPVHAAKTLDAYYSAAFEGHHEVLAYLLSLRTKNSDPKDLSQALWAAVWNCHPYSQQCPAADFEKCVRLLLDAGAPPHTKSDGNYPLIISAIFTRNPGGNPKVIDMLIAAGAEPNPEMQNGKRLIETVEESCAQKGCSVPEEGVLVALEKATGQKINRAKKTSE